MARSSGPNDLQRAVKDAPGETNARDRLLNAAIKVFSQYGFQGASLPKIGETAGVSFQLVTYYFGSKENLWRAALETSFEEAARLARQPIDPSQDYGTQLHAWLTTAFTLALHHPYAQRIIAQEAVADSERYTQHIKPMRRKFLKEFSYFFRQAHEQGLVPDLSTGEMMLIFRGIMFQLALVPYDVEQMLGRRPDQPATIEQIVDLVVRLFLRGSGEKILEK